MLSVMILMQPIMVMITNMTLITMLTMIIVLTIVDLLMTMPVIVRRWRAGSKVRLPQVDFNHHKS